MDTILVIGDPEGEVSNKGEDNFLEKVMGKNLLKFSEKY